MQCLPGNGWRRWRWGLVRVTSSFVSCWQAWRHALPGLGNQWLVLLKDTALVSLIGVNEMMRQAQMASASTYQPFTWYAAAALIYLAISLVSEYGLGLAARYTRRYGG